MKKYLLDTNALISFLTDRNIKQQKIIAEYFISASNLKLELVVTDIIICELIYVMENIYDIKPGDIHTILKSLNETPGIMFDSYFNFPEIIELWPGKIKDIGDALVSACARRNKTPVLTFDNKFKNQLKELKIPVKNLI